MQTSNYKRKPTWLRTTINETEGFRALKRLTRHHKLTTVCEEARCPNIYECWGEHKTATFMIFGDTCTRACQYCAVSTGKPGELNPHEPLNTAMAVKTLGLSHAVVTSVNRDDLEDGGSAHFAETIKQIRNLSPECRVEVLVPDFKGKADSIDTVLNARPDVFGHNTETVPRLYRQARPGSQYKRSLRVLKRAAQKSTVDHPIIVKTGIMLGLGETREELIEVMSDLREAGCDVLTLGQYLQPTRKNLPVDRYISPNEFDELKDIALSLGFKHCESGPLVRSSYHAHEHVPKA